MPNNSEVTTKEFAKIRGSKGGADWSQPWSRAQALAELCIPPDAYKAALNLRQRIEAMLDEALVGLTARLSGDEELGEHKTPLLNAVALVRRTMEEIGLNAIHPMYPVLWIRLLREAGVELKGHVYRQLGEWRLQCEAKGAVVFAVAATPAENARASSKLVPASPNQRYHRTVEELLLRPASKRGELYTLTWELLVISRSEPGGETATPRSKSALTATAEAKKKQRRKPKTMEHFNKICGSGTMENLAIALKKEAGSSRGLLVAESHGRYATELSADELCIALKQYQGKVLTGSDSTLRKALGAYVKLPRGRPPRQKPIIKKLR